MVNRKDDLRVTVFDVTNLISASHVKAGDSEQTGQTPVELSPLLGSEE